MRTKHSNSSIKIGGRKRGHPTKYKEALCEIAFKELSHGASLKELAKLFDVSIDGIYRWRRKYPKFFTALKMGRYVCDSVNVESSLYKKATGYEYTETSVESIVLVEDDEEVSYIEKVVDTNTYNEEGIKKVKRIKQLVPGFKRKVTVKHALPDTMACMFWLQNRQPEEWKNVQRQLVEGRIEHRHNHMLDLKKLTRGELEQLRTIVAKGARPKPATDIGGGGSSDSFVEPQQLRA